jgi:hypothetical protein
MNRTRRIKMTSFEVVVEVTAEKAVSGYPEGLVTVREGYNTANTCTITLGETERDLDVPGTSRGSCMLTMTRLGFNSITAVYDEAELLRPCTDVPYFFSSSDTLNHSVEEKPEPTPTMVPTSTPGPTATVTPTPTATATTDPYPPPSEVICPQAVTGLNISGNTIAFDIENSGKHSGAIAGVTVSWPEGTDPLLMLNAIYLGGSPIWSSGGADYLPPVQSVGVSSAAVAPGTTRTLMVEFSSDVNPTLSHGVVVNLDNTDPNYSCPAISVSR